MYMKMVVLIVFHSICVGSFNDLNLNRDQANNCLRICCDLEVQDFSCEKLNSSEFIGRYENSNFPDANIKLCEHVIPVNASEWFMEVIVFKFKY